MPEKVKDQIIVAAIAAISIAVAYKLYLQTVKNHQTDKTKCENAPREIKVVDYKPIPPAQAAPSINVIQEPIFEGTLMEE